MNDLLQEINVTQAALPPRLSDVLSKGVVCEEGCYFLASAYALKGNAHRESFPDATGYECYVNHLHLDEFAQRKSQLSVGLQFIENLAQVWRQSSFSDLPIRVILSIDGKSCVVRFHAIRADEEWCSDDLEAFDEAMMVCEI